MKASLDWRHLRSDDLRYVCALARTGTLVSAANALEVHHATVSRRIRALEATVGTRLITHGADGWELTEAGRAIASYGERIDEAMQQAVSLLGGPEDTSLSGTLRLIAPEGMGAYILVPALLEVRARHPKLIVEIISSTRQLGLNHSGFDLAIVIGAVNGDKFRSEKLSDGYLRLYASPEYLARSPRPQTVEDLRQHPLIFYVESLLQVEEIQLARYIPGAHASLASTSLTMQLEATRLGAGIGLLPRLLADRYPGIEPIDVGLPEMIVPIMLAARPESASRPAIRIVSDAIHKRMRELTGATGMLGGTLLGP